VNDIKTANDFYDLTEFERINKLPEFIDDYRAGDFYKRAVRAQLYLEGKNPGIKEYRKAVIGKSGKNLVPEAAPIVSRLFYRLVLQKSQYSLVNGLYLKDTALKARLGHGFDTRLLRMGENAITHGAAYGFWNHNYMVNYSALEFMPLMDEMDGSMRAGIRFWRLADNKPLNIELYEVDGVTKYVVKNNVVALIEPKSPYVIPNAGHIADGRNMPDVVSAGKLPIFTLWANPEKQSDFSPDMEANIDRYDRIFTDFGNNLDRTNDIYWVISNFGGTTDEVIQMLADINEIKATYAVGEGATALPHSIEVPHEARRVALELLNGLVISNFCGVDTASLSGGNKTATEIRLASADLDNNATRLESEVYDFCQKLILYVTGEYADDIRLKRKAITNETEYSNMILSAAAYIDHQTLLEKLPFIEVDEIQTILDRIAETDLGADEIIAEGDYADAG
jgi:hypothetical protein